MKKKLIFIASMILIMVCFLALTVNAECTDGCSGQTVVSLGDKGYLGNIEVNVVCTKCDEVLKIDTIQPMFETLGYSYNESGSMLQQYGANREAIAKYEELTGEKVKFGAVCATRNHVDGNPLNDDGTPVSDKVMSADFTSTKYDVFDVKVSNIPDGYRDNTDVICCAYIVAGGQVTYIDNGIEKHNADANSFNRVTEKVDNKEKEIAGLTNIKIINGARYKVLSVSDMELAKWSFWQSDAASNYTKLNTGTGTTHLKFYATKKYTKNELPNGTIILIADGWGYRPEGWINDAKNNGENDTTNPRPKTVYKSVIVDDAWWGSFTSRAFNITPGNAIPESVTAEDIYEIFKIYVPIGTVEQGTGAVVPPSVSEPQKPIDPTEDKTKQAWDDDGALKILAIGNSFSVDSMQYVYEVAEAAGVKEIVLGNLYIGGCTLATHLSNATNDSASYTYYKNTSGTWATTNDYKISTAVQSDDWDFISFQQASGYSGVADTYDNLQALIDIVEPLNPSARLVWHMTWAYQQDSTHSDFGKYDKDQTTMYNAIINAVQTKILTNSKIEAVIPAGTAIQNVRTSYVGDTLTRDGYHLSYDYGRYIGSLTFVKALTGLSIDNISYAPDGVTEDKILIAIEAVNNAILKPYEVTNSTYAEEPDDSETTNPDEGGTDTPTEPEGLVRVDYLDWKAGAFWNSTDNEFHSIRIGTSDNSPNFWATRVFTNEQLPVGSVIEIASGWQYRPDAWVTYGVKNNSRPGNVTTASITVTEEWWGSFTARGFNISKTSGASIKDLSEDEINSVFKIYVPESAYEKNKEPEVVEEESIVNAQGLVYSKNCVSEVTVIDGVEYRALTAEAMGLTPFSYYWSEQLVNELYKADANTAKKYFATKVFERDELVDGTLIWVADGWQYRPEGWIGNNTNSGSSRPGNTSTDKIVDSTWWGSYDTRAFNISMSGAPELAPNGYDTVEEVYEYFKIYIPVDKIAE